MSDQLEDSESNSNALAVDAAETTDLIKKPFTFKICKTQMKFSSESKIKYFMT